MLNKLWSWMIVISVIFACFCGRLKEVNSAIFDSLEDTITMTIKLVGIMCFWSGMIKILINTSVMNKLKKLLGPFVNKVYKDEDAETKELITINIVSNMMGIGNAATPTGIKAMKKMDSNCGDEKFSSSMCLFVLMNCLSIQILPSTIMSIMASMGSNKSGTIIFPVWISSILTFVIIMGIGRIIFRSVK